MWRLVDVTPGDENGRMPTKFLTAVVRDAVHCCSSGL